MVSFIPPFSSYLSRKKLKHEMCTQYLLKFSDILKIHGDLASNLMSPLNTLLLISPACYQIHSIFSPHLQSQNTFNYFSKHLCMLMSPVSVRKRENILNLNIQEFHPHRCWRAEKTNKGYWDNLEISDRKLLLPGWRDERERCGYPTTLVSMALVLWWKPEP